jgi:hypothetical protein
MEVLRPKNLILRCYGYKLGNNQFVGVCIDLNIAVQANSPAELKKKMNNAIVSYFEVVLDTDDQHSITILLSRKAPLRDWIIYYLIKTIVFVRQIPTNFIFQEYIPFHLAHNC